MQVIKEFPTLYGKAKSGKIKVWTIRVVEGQVDPSSAPCVAIEVTHGQQDGKMTVSYKKILEGKNIGRSNETTPADQAVLEAESQWKKQLDKNYRESVEELESSLFLLPMLAHNYEKRGKEIRFPACVQPKLDGVRALAHKVDENTIRFTSRRAKEFDTLDHLKPILLDMMEVGDIFDGELFTDKLTFQEIVSAVKRKSELTDLVEYHVYDMVDLEKTFAERRSTLLSRFFMYIPEGHDFLSIKPVKTWGVYSEDDIRRIHAEFTEMGYEGTMIRNIDGKYLLEHRSVDLQKFKDFEDAEFEIIGGVQGIGKSEGQCIFHCLAENGKVFAVRCRGTDEYRKYQWEHLEEFIGKPLTVRFQGRTDEGVPRFPVGIAVREEWDS